MEFDEIVVKESPGLCRCCLSEGCYKDMGTEYAWMNENEVYADMLLECFDISISQHNEGPNGPNRLICEVCITRLRDACYFKKQVLDTEKKFVDMLGRGAFAPKAVLLYQPQFKAESSEVEVSVEADVEYLEDDMDYVDDDALKAEDDEPLATVSADPLPVRGKRGRPRKGTTKPAKKVKVEAKAKSSKALVKGTRVLVKHGFELTEDLSDKSKIEITPKEKRAIMKQNVIEVLSKSTVMPFRWLKSSFRCFYCYDVFQEPKDLKSHQIVHTSEDDKTKAMKNYWEPTVYVDVSNLSCTICSLIMNDFYKLIDHLMLIHDMPFNKDIGICMSPFKLNQISVQCVQCDRDYRTFGHLLLHTNKEHKGFTQVLCEICGQHFRSTHHLKDHTNKEHSHKTVVCTLCGDELTSFNRMRTHMQNVHSKRYKCFICTELFETHYKRSSHMMTVHKNREHVKCQHCPKTFVFRSAMMRHLRETHLQERNALCGICGWRGFSENRLQRHMMKHSNERNVKCTDCDKSFKTKKTMKQHFNNIHQKNVGMQDMLPGMAFETMQSTNV